LAMRCSHRHLTARRFEREGSATGRSRGPRCKPPAARRRFALGLRSLGFSSFRHP
jgi:hypothetical protein